MTAELPISFDEDSRRRGGWFVETEVKGKQLPDYLPTSWRKGREVTKLMVSGT